MRCVALVIVLQLAAFSALGANGWDEARVAQAYMELADYYAGALPPSTMLLRPLRRLESGDTRPTGNLCRVGYAMWGSCLTVRSCCATTA